MRKKAPDIQIGDIFGDNKVMGEIGRRTKYGPLYYLTECQVCHRQKKMCRNVLIDNKGTSHEACGRGLRNVNPRFHIIWQAIRHRTTCPSAYNYQWYGGKGIKSDAFKYFIDFYDTMYESYCKAVKKYGEAVVSIERLNINKDYEPSNCIWIPMSEQHENTSRNRWFKAISPTGEEYTSRNQCRFAREHKLSDKQINACLNGRFKTHFGWSFSYIECND